MCDSVPGCTFVNCTFLVPITILFIQLNLFSLAFHDVNGKVELVLATCIIHYWCITRVVVRILLVRCSSSAILQQMPITRVAKVNQTEASTSLLIVTGSVRSVTLLRPQVLAHRLGHPRPHLRRRRLYRSRRLRVPPSPLPPLQVTHRRAHIRLRVRIPRRLRQHPLLTTTNAAVWDTLGLLNGTDHQFGN